MITVLFFASLREQLNCERLELAIEQNTSSLGDIKKMLVAQHPNWQKHLENHSLLCAINQQMGNENSVVKSGDEVAFFPPVTGG